MSAVAIGVLYAAGGFCIGAGIGTLICIAIELRRVREALQEIARRYRP